MVRLNKCSSWSSVLISVTWVELLWAVYRFLRINNIDLKCSFVRCRKYYKSWWNGAAEPHISVDLLCGTTTAEIFERWTFWKIRQKQIDSRLSANSWNMYALRRQIVASRTNESPRELARQSEAKRKQLPQSEANVCRHKCNLEKTSLTRSNRSLEECVRYVC